jgi:ATP-dependent exoDNAse (exonuclease V) beta subunit/CRISPR/Cas system-associated exonuclease Cas4 (RecB family)
LLSYRLRRGLVPVNDLPLQFPHFTVLRASAGSGKTYALARRFVLFLLSDRVPHNRLNNLLAITFSNNAAKEMKGRILDLLKQLCLGQREALADFTAALGLAEADLRARAGEVIEEVLSEYSDFQVKTIDSFMTTVFKASALDFGYDPDFEILMSNEDLMGYAFDLFLRRVREGTPESALMSEIVDIIMEQRGGDSPYLWEPTGEILGEITEIYRKVASWGKPVSRIDYSAALEAARKALRAAMEGLEEAIGQSGLVRNRGSSYGNLLKAVKAGRLSDLIDRGMKTAPVCRSREAEGLEAYEGVLAGWERLRQLIADYTRLFACSYYTPYLRVYEAFSAILERVKRHEGKIFIEDVNKRLAEYLSGEMVVDVYFRLGEVIFHYLIDEFQDTSPIQWHNLLPLLENSLSQGGSLFAVGDTKQAIYGFRDADYTIMRDLEAGNPFPSARKRVEELHTNYRSDGEVIAFAQEVFHGVLPGLAEYRKAGEESGLLDYRQTARKGREHRGFVETCLLERDDREPPERDRISGLLDRLIERGYSYSDIAILTSRNDDVVRVTTWLNARRVPFVSYSSLDIRRRRITGEVIALLTFLDSPPDDLSFATFILGDVFRTALEREGGTLDAGALHDLCFRSRQDRGRPLYKAFQEERPELWDRYFDRLFRLSGYLPLYDLVVEIYGAFDLFGSFGAVEEAALVKILEVVKDLEAKGGSTLRSFLRCALLPEGDETDWNMDIPYGIDAVKVMTVHKAKGLGFPVVILLLYGERRRGFRYVVQEDGETIVLLRLLKGMGGADEEFARRYAEEETKERVSRLNSLYVAFTRAASELYVIGVKREREGFPFTLFPKGSAYRRGEPTEAPARQEKEPVFSLGSFPHAYPFEIASPWEETMRFEERKRGVLVHRILSGIDYAEADLEAKVDDIAAKIEGEAGADQVPWGLKRRIISFLRGDALGPYYGRQPAREVMKEREVADAEGRLFLVDRVVVDPGEVTVIEFKTGRGRESEGKHLAQMGNYLRIMEELYRGRRIQGIIAYVDLGEVRRVGQGRDHG